MIDHLFPIPIGIYERPVKITNKELNFLENLKRRKNESNYTSVNDYILQCAELKDLYKFLKECLEDYVAQTIAPDQKQLQFYVTQSWSNYTKSGEYHQMHIHKLTNTTTLLIVIMTKQQVHKCLCI